MHRSELHLHFEAYPSEVTCTSSIFESWDTQRNETAVLSPGMFRKSPQFRPKKGLRDPYYSPIFHSPRIPKDMGMVWEAYRKGVPLLGVPGITLDVEVRFEKKVSFGGFGRGGHKIYPPKTNMTREKSPLSTGDTSSFMVVFPASHVSFRGGGRFFNWVP